jgi:hypothetical protein
LPSYFYRRQLIKSDIDPTKGNFFIINKILKTRIVDGNNELLVSYVGYDKTYNTWIKESDAIKELPSELS